MAPKINERVKRRVKIQFLRKFGAKVEGIVRLVRVSEPTFLRWIKEPGCVDKPRSE